MAKIHFVDALNLIDKPLFKLANGWKGLRGMQVQKSAKKGRGMYSGFKVLPKIAAQLKITYMLYHHVSCIKSRKVGSLIYLIAM